MKKVWVWICALMLLASATGALAGVRATPNQDLGLRTGPNREYAWLDTMPQSTSITAYEYEEGNGVTWVLVQYTYRGKVYRGYTGLKRMTVHGDIPWAAHIYAGAAVIDDCSVLAAPTDRAAWRANLSLGDYVSILEFEGDYAFIEFYDVEADANSRGYVESWLLDSDALDGEAEYVDGNIDEELDIYGGDEYIDGYSGYDSSDWEDEEYPYIPAIEAVPNQKLALRGCPDTGSVWLSQLSKSTEITVLEREKGNGVEWVLIEFYRKGAWERAYTPKYRVDVEDYVPWADHMDIECEAAWDGAIYAVPDYDGAYRGWLDAGESVTLLEYDGPFAFIEFFDDDNDRDNRGYVPIDMLD